MLTGYWLATETTSVHDFVHQLLPCHGPAAARCVALDNASAPVLLLQVCTQVVKQQLCKQ